LSQAQQVAKACFEPHPNNTTTALPILLFDGVCNFCNAGVNLCIDLDNQNQPTLRFASLQSHVGQSLLVAHGKDARDHSSIVLVTNADSAYFKSDAVLRVASNLNGLPWWIRFMSSVCANAVPKAIRDGMYQIVSKHRYAFGHGNDQESSMQCRLDLDGTLQARFVDDDDILPVVATMSEDATLEQ
jgi:predicted DCC family thiol-disulfide oxidoreductase YuxK